jgi:hypothetical protein
MEKSPSFPPTQFVDFETAELFSVIWCSDQNQTKTREALQFSVSFWEGFSQPNLQLIAFLVVVIKKKSR